MVAVWVAARVAVGVMFDVVVAVAVAVWGGGDVVVGSGVVVGVVDISIIEDMMMSVKPILFSSDMIRALLDGRKGMTRRIIKPSHEVQSGHSPGETHMWTWDIFKNPAGDKSAFPEFDRAVVCKCPYGKPGDLIWARETWRTGNKLDQYSPEKIMEQYKETGWQGDHAAPIKYEADNYCTIWGDNDKSDFGDWGKTRVSIHMPRWASRLTLKITDVRVERLQDISEEDAQAEGIIDSMYDGPIPEPWESGPTYRDIFADLWDSLNDARGYGWDINPWVWVVSFEVIKQNVDEYIKSL